jgi:hypothetical protein
MFVREWDVLYSNDYKYILSIKRKQRICSLLCLLLVLSVLDGPLHGIIHIVYNNSRFVGGFASSIHTGAKQDGRPLASKSTLVRVSASDIRFCSMISRCF